ncbi:uncharacterized protein At4g15545 isoform X1 [Eucalyptus grandis]|uniref:uncharacterized protein At4g15545 isoform X1 n=1 Tax=Eucalyptus grandis TaxID=71139 RepID=UPI00192ECFF5|nr:uncharacterized protein At4g15545 isoform X1 [Eucalyptus grandis]
MLAAAKDASAAPTFDLPDDVLRVLPTDPFDQLDVARKITSLALSARVSELESESSALRADLAAADRLAADLRSQIESLDATLADAADHLARADREKEELLRENASLSETVKKLNRDVAKLEVIQRTLMQSLREENESFVSELAQSSFRIQHLKFVFLCLRCYEPQAGTPQIIARPTPSDDDGSQTLSRSSSAQSRLSEMGNSSGDDPETDSRPGISSGLIFYSQTSNPRLTPLGSPLSLSLSVSPSRVSNAASPRWQSMSFATPLDKFDDRSSTCSSLPSIRHGSVAGSETGSQTGRTRVEGKEFLRQVRTRLPYEQFAAFLANVKQLNSRKQSKEETLRNAAEIFGADNKDLYDVFERLLTRHAHAD